ncbi:L-aspartate oxidase [Capillimicrobium parvum]|uniref:L-aspartate oxidase n=1 Tax=Capillimicrobium parvum TaxID=2884022 RepID=A0A9E6Y0U6_9ACTN|nr:FAD-dependent oxidoreductase [Capillimicrobium parvum]UGS37698.1 L-aspartate oxidase [Capillimicrobium parvum]
MSGSPANAPLRADVTVVGAGAAGLFTALTAASAGAQVALVSATPLAQTASYWAQGGLAAALAADDSPALHLEDTERAGRGIVRHSAAEVLCREAADRVHELVALGVRFDADRHGRLALGLEGGHSIRRVVHAGGSATGRRLVRQLSALAVEDPRVTVLERSRAVRIWTGDDGACRGLVLEDGRAIASRGVVLCTGGTAALWARTTNPPGSLGFGLMLAHRVGARLADLEFMQFHPTAVTGVRGREGFLITEAIRGEGATLHGAGGKRFVEELLPRDEVSRAVHEEMERTGAPSVGLDMRAIDPTLFPNVVAALQDAGLDPTRERIPVSPAAHYGMGGIVTDLDGRSTVAGLYAVGETACTGLHGANRLASNSLTECCVYGGRAARAALDDPVPGDAPVPEDVARLPEPGRETKDALWRHAGIVRNHDDLATLLLDPYPLARLIAANALLREESRGAHLRSDFPDLDPALDRHHTVIAPGVAPTFERWD